MPDFSLVPVDHQPDFSNVSLVPVDHDPFAGDGVTQRVQTQTQPGQPQPQSALQPSAMGAGVSQSNIGTPAVNSQAVTQSAPTYNNPEDDAAMSPETYVNPYVKRVLGNLATLPHRAIDAAKISAAHNYGPSPDVMSDSDAPFVDPLPAVAAEMALMMTMGRAGADRVSATSAEANVLHRAGGEGGLGSGGAEGAGPPASSFSGSRTNPLQAPDGPPRNSHGEFNGQPFSGHVFDQLQNRGIPPSAVENVIKNGIPNPGNTPGTTRFYDPINNVSVVRNNATGNIITIRAGN
jgi:hypothetical protein